MLTTRVRGDTPLRAGDATRWPAVDLSSPGVRESHLPVDLAAVAAETNGFLPDDEARALHAAAVDAPAGTRLEIGTYCRYGCCAGPAEPMATARIG